jgi:hypothetical protein
MQRYPVIVAFLTIHAAALRRILLDLVRDIAIRLEFSAALQKAHPQCGGQWNEIIGRPSSRIVVCRGST